MEILFWLAIGGIIFACGYGVRYMVEPDALAKTLASMPSTGWPPMREPWPDPPPREAPPVAVEFTWTPASEHDGNEVIKWRAFYKRGRLRADVRFGSVGSLNGLWFGRHMVSGALGAFDSGESARAACEEEERRQLALQSLFG